LTGKTHGVFTGVPHFDHRRILCRQACRSRGTWHVALAPSNQEGSVLCGGGPQLRGCTPCARAPSPSCLSKACAARISHRSRIFRTADASKSLADHSKTWVGRTEYHQRASKRLFRGSYARTTDSAPSGKRASAMRCTDVTNPGLRKAYWSILHQVQL
jgi:hypothetical protein